jgi:hypothetical protein
VHGLQYRASAAGATKSRGPHTSTGVGLRNPASHREPDLPTLGGLTPPSRFPKVTIPVSILREAGLVAGDELVIRASGHGRIEIERSATLCGEPAGRHLPRRLPRRAARRMARVALDADVVIAFSGVAHRLDRAPKPVGILSPVGRGSSLRADMRLGLGVVQVAGGPDDLSSSRGPRSRRGLAQCHCRNMVPVTSGARYHAPPVGQNAPARISSMNGWRSAALPP